MKVRTLILVFSMVLVISPGTSMNRVQDRVPAFDRTDACTDIVVGRAASADGSVITSHTGCCEECRVHVVPARTYPPGAMAPVYYGLQDVRKPLEEYGKIIGYIPQAEKTYAYFHTGYSHMNEHQLAIGESTLSQRDELKTRVRISSLLRAGVRGPVYRRSRGGLGSRGLQRWAGVGPGKRRAWSHLGGPESTGRPYRCCPQLEHH